MTASLKCPNCQASLNYEPDQHHATVHCDYCNSTVILPEALQAKNKPQQEAGWQNVTQLALNGRKIEAIKLLREISPMDLAEAKEVVDAMQRHEHIYFGDSGVEVKVMGEHVPLTPATSRRISRWVGCLFVSIFLLAGGITLVSIGGTVGLAGLGVWLGLQDESADGTGEVELPAFLQEIVGTVAPKIAATPTPGFVDVIWEVGGEEGTGPGFFDDTRWLATDGDGNIYTADFSDGRVQVFDKDGAFTGMWNAGIPIMGSMTVDRNGVLYASTHNRVLRYQAQDGTPLSDLPLPNDFRPDSLATAPDGSIVIFSEARILKISSTGETLLDVPSVEAVDPDSHTSFNSIALNGSGEMYVLGGESIYKFSSGGRFLDQFGSKGDADDQFSISPTAIVVDGAGRIFVASSVRIMVFEPSGRYLTQIPLGGVTFDMVVTDENNLLVMERNGNRIIKFAINP